MALLAILTSLLALVSRVAIGRTAAASGRVDHYYWMLMAEAYRTQRGLPVRIAGKYLMEDETQAYPPLFGLLLGRWRLDHWSIAPVLVLEAFQMCVLATLMEAFGASYAAIALALTIYAAAPVLVTYNAQLNSRILGEVFLFSLFAAEAIAVFIVDGTAAQIPLWAMASVLSALVIMSHKMTLQLYLVLLLPWSWALHSVMPLVTLFAGLLIYLAVVGPSFAMYQFRAHLDIVRFWNRYWPSLGGHQFRDSPIYGEPSARCSSCFHQPGLRGIFKHLRVVAAYAPTNLVLPFASLATASWPPTWLLVWLAGIYMWVLATLFVPQLKCLGGGHLYVFNAVGPGACYIAWLPNSQPTTAILGIGTVLSAVSLVLAWRIVRARPTARDEMFDHAVSALATLPKGRVAVFPLQSAEAVAWATHHAVLWGAHGYGFSRLEGFFPVLLKPLATYLREYEIGWVLWDDSYWHLGVERLSSEGLWVGPETIFGRWRIVECRPHAS